MHGIFLDIDECSKDDTQICPIGHQCVNTVGSFLCECAPGFQTMDQKCVGIHYVVIYLSYSICNLD